MTAEVMLAYHGDKKVKAHYLGRVRAHQKADEIVQGYGYWKAGKGCAVGCTLHSGAHAQYPIEMGIPVELAYLEDHFFENLPTDAAKKWPARFLSSIKVGADLSRVYDLWSAWNLIDPVDGVITLVSDAYPDIQRIVRETGQACLDGERINSAEAAEAAWAAGAARDARAARAARSARAARAARTARTARAVRGLSDGTVLKQASYLQSMGFCGRSQPMAPIFRSGASSIPLPTGLAMMTALLPRWMPKRLTFGMRSNRQFSQWQPISRHRRQRNHEPAITLRATGPGAPLPYPHGLRASAKDRRGQTHQGKSRQAC